MSNTLALVPDMNDDDESAESVLLQRDAARLFLLQRKFLVLNRGPVSDDTKHSIVAVYKSWMRYFLPLNIEISKGDNLRGSISDLGFVSMCHAWATAPGIIYPHEHAMYKNDGGEPKLSWIGNAHAKLVAVSCQHTLDSREFWPTPSEAMQMRRCVARIVVAFMDTGARERAKLIEDLTDADTCIDPAVAALYAERKHPSTLIVKGDDVSEEAGGSLWRNSTLEIVNGFVRLASRVFYKIDMDRNTVRKYAEGVPVGGPFGERLMHVAPRFTWQTIQRVHDWVAQRCRVEQTEELTKLFRDTANEWWCPMSTETQRYALHWMGCKASHSVWPCS
jgi:hypothetical protein